MLYFILVLLLLLVLLFLHLIQQSKHPTGFIGRIMLKIWNRAYLPMVQWALEDVSGNNIASKILDIGVGNGASTRYLQERFPHATVVGIDISETAIQAAKKLNQQSDIEFLVQDIKETTFPEETFAFVCAFQTHFHWDDVTTALQAIKRALTKDGTFLIACETAKLNYYMKDLASTESFAQFLSECGLTLVSTKSAHNWTAYIIKKKEEAYEINQGNQPAHQ